MGGGGAMGTVGGIGMPIYAHACAAPRGACLKGVTVLVNRLATKETVAD